jgi:hypothetical protein
MLQSSVQSPAGLIAASINRKDNVQPIAQESWPRLGRMRVWLAHNQRERSFDETYLSVWVNTQSNDQTSHTDKAHAVTDYDRAAATTVKLRVGNRCPLSGETVVSNITASSAGFNGAVARSSVAAYHVLQRPQNAVRKRQNQPMPLALICPHPPLRAFARTRHEQFHIGVHANHR